MRGILREHGFSIGVGAQTALKRIPALLDDATVALPELVRQTVWLVFQEVRELEERIAGIDHQLARVVREHPVACRLHQIPGVGVGGNRLRPTTEATTVRVKNGKSEVLDGPYADTKEQLAGYYLIDVPDLDAALSWASRCPGASNGTMEVRPVQSYDDEGNQS